MFCGNCGFPLADDAIFCTRCGTRLRAAAPAQPFNEVKAPAEEAKPTEQETPFKQETPFEQVTPAEQKTPFEQPSPVEQAPAEQPAKEAPAEQPTPAEQAAPTSSSEQPAEIAPEQPAVPEKKPAEKEFFGKGAFIFCLVIIALLSIACGIFAGLYFGSSTGGKAGIVARNGIVRDYFDDNYEGGFIEW